MFLPFGALHHSKMGEGWPFSRKMGEGRLCKGVGLEDRCFRHLLQQISFSGKVNSFKPNHARVSPNLPYRRVQNDLWGEGSKYENARAS